MIEILVAASKGGVGKTLVTLNVAYALNNLGYKVGVMDCDITMPAISKYLKIEDKTPEDTNEGVNPINADGVKVMSTGLLMDNKQPVLMSGQQRAKLVQQFIDKCNWQSDYLIIDTPPGAIDEIQYLIRARYNDIYGAIVVTTPSEVAISQVRRSMALFRELKVKIIGVVGNMMAYECPHCRQISPFYMNGGNSVEKLAKEFKAPLIAELPIYPRIDQDPLHFAPIFESIFRGAKEKFEEGVVEGETT
jgi:ATP-binding protein involved in chromosome partitioning